MHMGLIESQDWIKRLTTTQLIRICNSIDSAVDPDVFKKKIWEVAILTPQVTLNILLKVAIRQAGISMHQILSTYLDAYD